MRSFQYSDAMPLAVKASIACSRLTLGRKLRMVLASEVIVSLLAEIDPQPTTVLKSTRVNATFIRCSVRVSLARETLATPSMSIFSPTVANVSPASFFSVRRRVHVTYADQHC